MKKAKSLGKIVISFGNIWLDKSRSRQIRLTLLFLILQLLIIIFFFSKLPPQVPLFFSRPWGELQLTSPFYLLVLPLFSFIVLLINLLLSSFLLEDNEFLTNLFIFGSLTFSFFALIALLKSIQLAL